MSTYGNKLSASDEAINRMEDYKDQKYPPLTLPPQGHYDHSKGKFVSSSGTKSKGDKYSSSGDKYKSSGDNYNSSGDEYKSSGDKYKSSGSKFDDDQSEVKKRGRPKGSKNKSTIEREERERREREQSYGGSSGDDGNSYGNSYGKYRGNNYQSQYYNKDDYRYESRRARNYCKFDDDFRTGSKYTSRVSSHDNGDSKPYGSGSKYSSTSLSLTDTFKRMSFK